MQIEDFKRWQWAILGLIAGLIFSYAWQDHDVEGDKTYELAEIKQNTFERGVLSKSNRDSGEAILQSIRVEPAVRDYQNNLRQIVVGKRLRFDPKAQKEVLVPFYYYASIPYVPHIVPNGIKLGTDATVMDYLAAAQKANPLLHFRFAWELQSNYFMALWAVGGVIVVGGIWPTILNALTGAGFGRPPKSKEESEEESYLSRFGKGSEPAPVVLAKGVTDGERQQLDDMNAALESKLAAAGVFATAAPAASAADPEDSTAGTVIVPLGSESSAEPVVVTAQQPPEEESEEERARKFAAGDFYPVARGSKKE